MFRYSRRLNRCGPCTNAGAAMGVVYCLTTSSFFIGRSLLIPHASAPLRSRRSAVTDVQPSSLIFFKFERHLDLGPVGFDLAVGDLHVEFDDFSNAKVSQTLRSAFDSSARGFFPGLGAGAHQFNNFVNTLSHGVLPPVAGSLFNRFPGCCLDGDAASDRYRNDCAKTHADRCAALTCFISIFLTFFSGISPAAFFKRSNSSARNSVSFSISGTAVRHAMRPKSRLSR